MGKLTVTNWRFIKRKNLALVLGYKKINFSEDKTFKKINPII